MKKSHYLLGGAQLGYKVPQIYFRSANRSGQTQVKFFITRGTSA